MSHLNPPIFDFDKLKPVTMTIISSLNVTDVNLDAIFALLPTTKRTIPLGMSYQRKQGKIKLPPELNDPGIIISMRWKGQVKGIVRSETARSFPHSIIIDIGTSQQIVSLKLSKTIELTGARSEELAEEASRNIIKLVKQCQSDLNLTRNNQELAKDLQEKFLTMYESEDNYQWSDEYENENIKDIALKIWSFYQRSAGITLDQCKSFFNFLNNFRGNLYNGEMRLRKFEYEMVNLHFHLGYTINKVRLVEAMNRYPFVAIFNTSKSSPPVKVHYFYTKYERNTGKPIRAKHTIQVNQSGHVRHSGPNLKDMKPVYYAFVKRTLECYDQIQSIESQKVQIRLTGPTRVYSIGQWKDNLNTENKLREKILNNEVPIATGEQVSFEISENPNHSKMFQLDDTELDIDGLTGSELSLYKNLSEENALSPGIVRSKNKYFNDIMSPDKLADLPTLEFDYQPLLSYS